MKSEATGVMIVLLLLVFCRMEETGEALNCRIKAEKIFGSWVISGRAKGLLQVVSLGVNSLREFEKQCGILEIKSN